MKVMLKAPERTRLVGFEETRTADAVIHQSQNLEGSGERNGGWGHVGRWV